MYKRQSLYFTLPVILTSGMRSFIRLSLIHIYVERGERGSTEEHLTVTQFKVQAETQRLEMCIRDSSNYEAAQRLAADFGISSEPGQPVAVPHKLKHPYIRQFREDEMLCFRVLTDYLHLLEDWKVWYAPKTPDDALDDRFVEACQMIDYIEYLADILTVGDLEERVAVVDELMKNGKITFLQDYTTRKKKEDMRHERRNDADLAL